MLKLVNIPTIVDGLELHIGEWSITGKVPPGSQMFSQLPPDRSSDI